MTTPITLAALALLSVSNGTDPVSDQPVLPQDAEPQGDEAAEVEKEDPRWKGSVLLGISQVQGNAQNFSASMTADAVLEREMDRYTVNSFYHYVESEDELIARRAGLNGQYDYLAGEDYYYFGTAGAENDELANRDLRWWAGGGAGYTLYDEENFTLNTKAGVTYFVEEFSDGSDSEDVSLVLGYDLDYVMSAQTNFRQVFVAYPPVDAFEDVFLRLDSRIETSLTPSMLGSVQYVLDWDNSPAPGAKRDDHRILFSLGWSFGR